MTTYLGLLSLFCDETDPNVWSVIIASGQYLYHMLDAHQRPALQRFLRHLLTPIVQKLGLEPAGRRETNCSVSRAGTS